MKNLFKGAILIMAAVLVCACNRYKYESVPNDPTGMRIYTLDNGLKVYMSVNKDQPRIDAQIAVKVGGKDDPRETTGLAHYFEHLMFKGTRQFGTQNYELEKPMLDQIEQLFEQYRQTEDEAERKAIYHTIDSVSLEASKIAIPNEYDKLMASIGASGTNAYTSWDVTCYVENIPSNQIENWAKVQADRFENCVLRGFHTELETIYEEYNMYAAQDQQKLTDALFGALFPTHPYNIDVIGLPSHLKNPSITNVKNYHDMWYVPNNVAIVMSGDFDPDQTIRIIDRYFGDWQPREGLKHEKFAPEAPITAPIVKDVRGNEAPVLAIAWRFPGANQPEALMLDLISSVMNNGKAGLIDVDVNQQQKTLGMGCYSEGLADYTIFLCEAEPKEGQTLDQCADIFFEELDKLKAGDFDESMLEGIVNNMKLSYMQRMDNGGYVARMAVNSFIEEQPWEEVVSYVDRLSKITKEEIVAFANENFGDNYVRVNKLQEKDPADTRIAKPQISPIYTNRDTSSQFLRDMQAAAAAVKPIEPVFVDYNKDMTVVEAKPGVKVLYKKNESTGTFSLNFMVRQGSYVDKALPFACDYFDFLGTSDMTPAEVKAEFFKLACSYNVYCSGKRTYVTLSGLAENMDKALALLEKLIADAQPNPEMLEMLKFNTFQERRNSKTDQRTNFSRLQAYALYGPVNPSTSVLKNSEIMALTDEELIAKIKDIFSFEQTVLYYGPLSQEEFLAALDEDHKVADNLAKADETDPFEYRITEQNKVILAPYDANQLQLVSISNKGDKYDSAMVPMVRLYNEYFGGGMNSIVFQEMREARGLAYSAGATYALPGNLKDNAYFLDRIYTQNDKMMDALDAFDDIINNMPVSEAAFKIAKESLISNLRTQRTVKFSVLNSYLNAQELGLDYDINKDVYEKARNYTLEDVVKFQQENIKDRKYSYCILGRIEDLDLNSLLKYGPIQKVTTDELFGY